jgi:peptidoglycan DL-endopeptidase CwlO
MRRVRRSLRRAAGGSAAVVLAVALSLASHVNADPASDALSKLHDLSRQALQSRDAVTTAQRDAEAQLAAQTSADDHHRADLAALEAANSQLEPYQAAVGRVAAADYMSGHTGGLSAVLTAASPQQLIDRLSLQRAIAAETADQMKAYLAGRDRAAAAAKASEISAAEARAAAERSAAVRADLQAKFGDLQRQIAAAEAQYAALTPQQQAVIDNAVPPPPPPDAPVPADPSIVAMPDQPPEAVDPALAIARVDIPDALPVGVANETGLQANTVLVARAISARFPQIGEIDGVRPDSKPWHPNGLAIDIMIPNPSSPEGIALGDEIKAYVMSNAGRFGMQDVIWRGTYYTPGGPSGSGYGHFDHVHVTTLPRR